MRRVWASVMMLVLAAVPFLGMGPATRVEAATPPVISEIRIDQPSSDNDEYFELAGTPGMALDGLTYLVIGDGTGGSGVIEAVVNLAGQAIPASGYFVAAEATFTLGTADLVADLNFENSDNVTHLLVNGFTGSDGDDLDTDDDGVLDITPWTELVDLIAVIEEENPPSGTEYHYGPPAVGPDGAFMPGHAYLCPAAWQIGAFDPVGGDDTPGAANICLSAVDISEIRGDQPGGDDDEYFELAGPAGMPLDGLTYLVIGDGTGGSGVIEVVVDLTGQAIPASGYFVAAEATFTLGTADLVADLNFENSDNVTHLLVNGFTGSDGDDLDTDDDGVLDITPWTELVDLIAVIEEENPPSGTEYHYGPPAVGPDGAFMPGHAYLCPEAWQIGAFDPVGGDDTPGAANPCTPPAPDVIINELDADTDSTDVAEFIELYDGGMGNQALDGLVVVLFNGNGDVSYGAYDLDTLATGADGYFVLCSDATQVPNCDLDVTPDSNLIQNGADAAALYLGDASDFPNGTVVTNTNLLDAIVYDTNDADDAGLLAVLLNPGQPQVDETAGPNGSAADSNQRCPNGEGGARNTDTYLQALPSPGAANACPTPGDLTIEKLGPEGAIADLPGQVMVYDITLENTGDVDATNIVLTDTLPGGTSYISDNSGVAPTNPTAGVYVWALPDLGGMLTATLRLTVSVDTAPGVGVSLVNEALVSTDLATDDPANNTATFTTTFYSHVTIYDVQTVADPSSSDVSPYNGQTVWVDGIVTAVTGEFDNRIFVLEDAAGGPWSGLPVYGAHAYPVPPLAEGDHARVLGTVGEYNGLTELYIDAAPAAVEILSAGNPVPAPAVLPTGDYVDVATAEQWESVLIEFQTATVTNPDLGYGEWAFDDGSGETAADDMGAADGDLSYEPAADDMYHWIRGIGWYSFGAYKVLPRYDADIRLDVPGPFLTKDAQSTVMPGERFTYTLTVENVMGFDLTGVVISDTVPANAEFAYALDGGELLPGNIVSWTAPVLPNMTSIDVRFAVTATGATGDEIWNEAYQVVAGNWPTPTLGAPLLTYIGGYLPIYEIQGDSWVSPYEDQEVTTMGVVLGFFEGNASPNFDGFFIQDVTGDGDGGTSDGIYIKYSTSLSPVVGIGDLVEVTGLVEESSEYDNTACPDLECQTAVVIDALSDVDVVGSGAVTPVMLDPPGDPTAAGVYWEALEGMWVTYPNTVTVVGPTNYNTVQVVDGALGLERVMRAGPHAGKPVGLRHYLRYGDIVARDAPNLIVGSIVQQADGPLAYTYGSYAIITQPGDSWEVVESAPVPAVAPSWPEPGGDTFSLGSLNAYNFDAGSGYSTKLAKIVDAIVQMGAPSFVGLQEIATDQVMDNVITALATEGYPYDYAFSHGDTRGFGVVVMWRTDLVSNILWSTHQDCSINGNPEATAYDNFCEGTGLYPLWSRRPVVVTGTVTTTGLDVVVIGNHFKSKLGGLPSDIRRLEQAQSLAGLVDQLVLQVPNVSVLGDLNDFEDSPPLDALTASGNLLNTWFTLPEGERYSYIYNGVSQTLDHILVSPALMFKMTGFSPLHFNADFPYYPFSSDPSVVWRMSDHDPLAATFEVVVADYSDLPGYDAAWHVGPATLWLGDGVDNEVVPGGDPAPEDNGVTRDPGDLWQPGNLATVYVSVTIEAGDPYLAAWFDWNGDGAFDTAEVAIETIPTAGMNAFDIMVPASYTTGDNLSARFRLYADLEQGAVVEPAGSAINGEVEDYAWTFGPTAVVTTQVAARTAAPWASLVGLLLLGTVVVIRRQSR